MGILFPSSLEASFETSTEVLEPLQAESSAQRSPRGIAIGLASWSESIRLVIFISQRRLQKQFALELFIKGFGRVFTPREH